MHSHFSVKVFVTVRLTIFLILQVFGGQGVRLDGKVKPTQNSDAPQIQRQEIKRGIPNYGYKKGKLTFIRQSKNNSEVSIFYQLFILMTFNECNYFFQIKTEK